MKEEGTEEVAEEAAQDEEAVEPVNPYPPGQPIEQPEQVAARTDPTPVEQYDTNAPPEGTGPSTDDQESDIPADQLASDGDAVVEGLPEEGSESPSAEE